MKNSLRGKIIVAIICILLIIVSFGADKIMFHDAKMKPSDFLFKQTTLDKPKQAKTTIWFKYGEQRELQLGRDRNIDSYNITIFSKESATKIAKYNSNSFSPINKNTVGYVIASYPEQLIDINNDGQVEKVYDFTRTEFGTYAYLGGPPELFNSKEIPFELLFSEGKHIKVFYNGKNLTKGKIIVNSPDGKTENYEIDDKGNIKQLPISYIRKGFTGVYTPDGSTYYRMYYVLEGYDYFSKHYFSAYIPLVKLIVYSIAGIIMVYVIRNEKDKKKWEHSVYSRRGKKYKSPVRKMTNFDKVRWGIMIISFFAWTFLGAIIMQGQRYNQITVPVLTCPFNFDQVVQSSCFYMSHLNHLFEEGWKFYVPFLGTLLLCMVFLGRILCGFICPFGFIQDLLEKIRHKLNIKPIIVSDRMIKLIQPIKWIWIILFLSLFLFGGDFCDICPNKIISPALGGYWIEVAIGGFIGVIVIVGSFYIKRFWCLMCPLGYILGIFHKYNIFKLKKDCVSCTECGACYEECPMKLKNIYTERKTEDIQETDCLMCGKCIDKCPEDKGLEIRCFGKTVYTAKRKRFISKYKNLMIKKKVNK